MRVEVQPRRSGLVAGGALVQHDVRVVRTAVPDRLAQPVEHGGVRLDQVELAQPLVVAGGEGHLAVVGADVQCHGGAEFLGQPAPGGDRAPVEVSVVHREEYAPDVGGIGVHPYADLVAEGAGSRPQRRTLRDDAYPLPAGDVERLS